MRFHRQRPRVIPVGIPGHEIPAMFTPGENRWERIDEPAPRFADPHGIATPETLAALVAQAEAEPTTEWDRPADLLMGEQTLMDLRLPSPWTPEPTGPPPMPYPSGLSRIMVHQIAYPDPADLTPDKDRRYRDMLRRVGVATGTRTSLEDTGAWALPALPAGDGTGVRL